MCFEKPLKKWLFETHVASQVLFLRSLIPLDKSIFIIGSNTYSFPLQSYFFLTLRALPTQFNLLF